MKNLYLSIITLFFFASPGTAQEIHLEHSLNPVFSPSGSSWGTEGKLIEKLNSPESQIPVLYKSLRSGSAPLYIDLSGNRFAKGRFTNNQAILIKNINICYDTELPKFNSVFEDATENFLDQIAGKKDSPRPLSLSFLSFPNDFTFPEKDCDLIIVKGSWRHFPYSELQGSFSSGGTSWQNMIYGIYYRHSKDSTPVITTHPDIEITYDSSQVEYVTEKDGTLLVDGRVLILHEIGHFLGFAHLGRIWSNHGFSELTVMGKIPSTRTGYSNEMRFKEGKNLWQFWDIPQTNIYRRLLWTHFGEGSE